MKVVIAIDSFKGSMSSKEAGEAAARGVRKVFPKAEILVKPLADGGEGTTEALVEGLNGVLIQKEVSGPLKNPVTAAYGILDENTAILEMAQASGITLIDREELDPYKTSTYGTGEMILDALDHGIRNFIIGIGGSATTEGGIGMLKALGVRFIDQDQKELPDIFDSLEKIETIDTSSLDPRLAESNFLIACDVNNPLTGSNGAVAVFGPQKGVQKEQVASMDQAMEHYADQVSRLTGKDLRNVPGAGAAGGLGFAFLSFLNAQLKPGIELILDYLGFKEALIGCDVLITGEGRLDGQTAMGKVPVGVARLAKEVADAKTIAFAGGVTEDALACNENGIDAFFPIVRGVTTLDEAMEKERAQKNMELAVEQAFRLLK